MNEKKHLIICCMVMAAALGCSKQPPKPAEKSQEPSIVTADAGTKNAFGIFYVYQDKGSRNKFTPSGYMPNGECLSLDDGWQYDVKEGKTCTRVVYDVACSRESRKWAGVYWLNPADNWGERPGGYNLTGAKKLVFWAKGELGGERIEEFRIGGVGSDKPYPDSDVASIGPVILTKEWKEYVIDLLGKDLSYISGGFAWVANVESNPHHCTFYLDNIRFE